MPLFLEDKQYSLNAFMEYSNYMVASSMLFQIPAYYGYHHSLYYHAFASWMTGMLSMNYWRDAKPSWRRNMDVHWARGAGIFYVIHGRNHLHLGIPGMLMLFLYYQSCSTYEKNKFGRWYVYHMVFHGMAAAIQLASMYYMTQDLKGEP